VMNQWQRGVVALGIGFLLGAQAGVAGAVGWQALPIYAGDIRSLAITPDAPDVLYAGTSAGQLYISRDGGLHWIEAGTPLPFPGWVVSALAFDPNKPGRLWAGLRGVWGGGQVAFSDNQGQSWSARSQGLSDQAVYSLALTPGRPGRLFAGTLEGVFGSDDDGASWRLLTSTLPDLGKVTSLLVDPHRPESVIAGTWRQAYRSDDGGRTWSGSFDGMVLDTEVFSMLPIADRPGEIWASTCGWVYQTVDHGDHWQRFKDGLDERRTPSIERLPDGRMLAGTVSGVFVSEDAGHNWRRQSDPALDVSVMGVHPARPQRVIVGTEGAGIWISEDGGANYRRASQGLTNIRVAALVHRGDEVLVGVNDAGVLSGVYVSRDGGTTFPDFSPLPTILDLAVFGRRTFAATERGLFEQRGNDWFRVAETGTGRVEQLEMAPERLVARTSEGIFELRTDRFARVAYQHGPPRSLTLYGGSIWVSDAQALYSLTATSNHTFAGPAPNGHLQRLGDRLVWTGAAGAFLQGEQDTWTPLIDGPSRALRTGDERFSGLLLSGETARLFDRQAGKLRVVKLPFPARDLTSALVANDRLLLGSSGYGVQVLPLTELFPEAATVQTSEVTHP
jgi:photosystem II stability/assembly factor-like uncharacterized protein